MNVKIHNSKDGIWKNASGDSVPLKWVTKSERQKEVLAAIVYKAAVMTEAILLDLHVKMTDSFSKVKAAILEEYAIKGKDPKKTKGSFTWYNFDRSIKIEADVNESIKWDEVLLTEAQDLLNKYLSTGINENATLIKDIVLGAFSKSKGQVDNRKIFQLLKFEKSVKNKDFQKACELIKQAQNFDKSKLYMRVFEKTDSGQYRMINLNFSAI
jgi:hypothetical protein